MKPVAVVYLIVAVGLIERHPGTAFLFGLAAALMLIVADLRKRSES